MKPRRNYDQEFKQMAVDLSHHRDDIGKLAEELEIKPDLLYRWRREAKKAKDGAFPGGRKSLFRDIQGTLLLILHRFKADQ